MTLQSPSVCQLLRSLEFTVHSYQTLGCILTSFATNANLSLVLSSVNRWMSLVSPSHHGEFDLLDLKTRNTSKRRSFFVADILGPTLGKVPAENEVSKLISESDELTPHIITPGVEQGDEQSDVPVESLFSFDSPTLSRDKSSPKLHCSSEMVMKDLEIQHTPVATKCTSPMHRMDKTSLPAWVFCTRYSDRPSSGPRSRKPRRLQNHESLNAKRPRTSFTTAQLRRLGKEFEVNRYLDENRRANLATELDLQESQVKIWFQNKRAKAKRACCSQDRLAVQLMAQGLYNHSVRTRPSSAEPKPSPISTDTTPQCG